jgi:hypothetical protein
MTMIRYDDPQFGLQSQNFLLDYKILSPSRRSYVVFECVDFAQSKSSVPCSQWELGEVQNCTYSYLIESNLFLSLDLF